MRENGAIVDQVVEQLAMAKAKIISIDHSDKFIIGADQMLACEGVWYDKPEDIESARGHLKSLRGKLISWFLPQSYYWQEMRLAL